MSRLCLLVSCVVIMSSMSRTPLAAQDKPAVKPTAKPSDPMVLPEGRPPADEGPRIAFSLDSSDDINMFTRTNGIVHSTCVRILSQYAGGEIRDEEKFGRAVRLLREMRADDEVTVRALCAVMTRFTPSAGLDNTPHPLKGRGAAQLLVHIGGSPRVADTMMGRLRHEVTDDEMRTYTYIFFAMDKVPVTTLRLELAIERETNTPVYGSPDKKYLERLEQIKDSISQPGYFNDRKNWPWRQP